MKITIYNTDRAVLVEAYALDRSSQDWGIMTDNTLSLEFETSQCVILPPGCYVEFDGTKFFLLEEYRPTLLNKTRWQYNVTFRDATSLLSVVAALNTIDGKNTPLMVLTAPVYEHALIVISNMNRFFGDITWAVGEIVSTENIEIDYTSKYCSDILTELCSKTDLEWWFDGYTLNIGRCEFGELLELGYMNGLLGDIECSQANNALSYAYLYPIGSTRNIDPTQYGNDRLQLPDGIVRIPMNSKGIAELVEETAFAGIYPRYVATVSAVRAEQRTGEDGSPFTIYYVADNNLPFDPNEYEIAGLVKQITFQSGELMGREFEVNFNSDTKEIEIITQFPYEDIQLPGGVLIPAVGDQFVIWNITMPIEYYTLASQEFLEAAQQFAKDTTKDTSVYKAATDYIYIQEQEAKLIPGQRVRLLSDYYFPDKGYYDSRITHISRDMGSPYIVSLEISAVRSMSTLARLAARVKNNEVVFRQLSASIPPIVKSWEETAATDSNIYSARKSEKEFLNQRKGGSVEGEVAFRRNVILGDNLHTADFVDAGVAGAGFGVTRDANGNAVITTDIIKIRKKAEFYELVINQTTFELGTTVHSLAGCSVVRVEELDNVYRCYYDNKEGKRYSGFKVDDQARCQRYDASYNSIVRSYWRVVASVGEDYVDLYKSGRDANGTPYVEGSDIPMEGDDLVHFGNRTDKTRQSVIVITNNPQPAILQYQGIDSFSLNGKVVTQISPDNNRFTGKINIEPGSTGVENIEGLPKVIQDAISKSYIGGNLLRNSGFTGDYTPIEVEDISNINGTTNVYSESFKYWEMSNAIAQASEFSQSGVEVVITNGYLSQSVGEVIVINDIYIFSLYAKGETLSFSFAGVNNTLSLTDEYKHYILRFEALSKDNTLRIFDANATICTLQIERGTIATSWSPSMYDNDKSLSYLQQMNHLLSAMKDGGTSVIGGLILSSILQLGNYQDGEMREVTSGISGVYNKPDDVALWAGGSLEMAIRTVNRFRQNPNYMPANEDWSEMAKYVTTHGGDTFMRGYIYALGGYFRGMVDIANGKIRLNTDGSGHFANRNISWDEDGRVQKTSPDSIIWTNVLAYSGTNHIDYSKGAYLDLEYSDGQLDKDIFTLENGKFDGFTIIVKGAPVASDNEKSAILAGTFIMPNGDIVTQLKASYISNGVSIEALGNNTPVWRVKAPYYKIKDDIASISDVREAVTKVIRIKDADNLNHTMTFENGILVEDDVRGSEI